MSLITHSIADSIGTLTLNQPEKRNALSSALIDELISGLDDMTQASVHDAPSETLIRPRLAPRSAADIRPAMETIHDARTNPRPG